MVKKQQEKKEPNTHLMRVITGVIGGALLISIIAFGNVLLFWLVVSTAIVIGLLEFYNLAETRYPIYKLPGMMLGWLLSLSPLLHTSLRNIAISDFTFTLIVLSLFLYILFTKRSLSETFPAFGVTVFGILYVSWLLGHLVLLRGLSNGKEFVFYLLLVVWSGDTGAYYTGRTFGQHKLAPIISPKKTIEGGIGGIFSSLLASCLAKFTFLPLLSYSDCVVLGIVLAAIAQCGDLSESFLKRAVNIKDSGNILPGHGGILDRLDGVMFAAPVLYYYAVLLLVA
jgi:phosphatidate cytidylyltransferase